MFALTFFGVLHVPINVPAIGMQTGEDNVDVDRELKAHGISNVLSGFCGSIQVSESYSSHDFKLTRLNVELSRLREYCPVHEKWWR